MIKPCLSAYLIKKSYLNIEKVQLNGIISNYAKIVFPPEEEFDEEDFIRLRKIGNGSVSTVELWYHIKKQKLFAIKIQNCVDEKLFQREIDNYENYEIKNAFIPKFYGIINNDEQKYLIIVNKNIQMAKEYFHEAIKYQNCKVAMYNLANILLDEKDENNDNYNEAIRLLIESSSQNFLHSMHFLYIIFYLKHQKISLDIIKEEIKKYKNDSDEIAFSIYFNFYPISFGEFNYHLFKGFYDFYHQSDFIYIFEKIITFESLKNNKFIDLQEQQSNLNINQEFYQGFGEDLFETI